MDLYLAGHSPNRQLNCTKETMNIDTLDKFTRAYIEAALWATNESTPSGVVPLDEIYDIEDIDAETLKDMVADCVRFQRENENDISHNLRLAGHDFWLTRNGHGSGFWDGDWGEAGDRLTEASKKYGEVNLYVGDDGKIYQ